MQNDRLITISVGSSRNATQWQRRELLISAFYASLRDPVKGSETLAEYLALPKSKQDALKDVGGFVGGALSGTRRKLGDVAGRDLLTLDLDNIPAGRTEEVLARIAGLGCGYCVYSTRKHSPAAPRLRVIIPLNRTVTAEEHEPIARRAADYIGLNYADPTTFEANRLMFYPSCCSDSVYIYSWEDKPLLSADGMLATYADWRDIASYPALPGQKAMHRLAVRQGDPEAKTGVVGAFCRVYDIYRAMAELIPGVYSECDNQPGRYTFLEGSTSGGAVIYEDGKFLYSHHATDPCSGKLVNSFDLVRLHKFDSMDEGTEPGTPAVRLPSFRAMSEFALSLPEVSALLAKERFDSAISDFSGLTTEAEAGASDWQKKLAINSMTGQLKQTIDNVLLILDNDPLLKDRFATNSFTRRVEVSGALPWDNREERRVWGDNDNQGLYWYIEKIYRLTGQARIDAALSLHNERCAYNELQDYLTGLHWDGAPRADTLLIDYLGAEDTPYTRAVTRKTLCAAVQRAMQPGCKFDNMLILSGPQGIGKSSLLDRISRGFFNDSIRSFDGKEAAEMLRGVWIAEIAELQAFNKADTSLIKQFLSTRCDIYRAAYARHTAEYPRSCILIGTTNAGTFLRDATGERRFWPVDVGVCAPTKSVWNELSDEVGQIWAEAYERSILGEALTLEGAAAEAAKLAQDSHREASEWEGIISEFLARLVPPDWQSRSLDDRLKYWEFAAEDTGEKVPRDRVCAAEIWCEALHGQLRYLKRGDVMQINAVIAALPEWEPTKNGLRMGPYGFKKGFQKVSRTDT